MTIDTKHSPVASMPNRRAFTLIELMISIALSLLLILGVNQIFKYTTLAVGSGEAINSAIRSSRALQTTFSNDLGSIVGNGNGPNDAGCIIISSRAAYAYSNAKDLASEGTISGNAPGGGLPNTAYIDINGDGQFGDQNVLGEVVWPAVYNFRNHRLDCLSFFARNTFPRQTGNVGTFVDNMTGTEAWIWYGHLWLPTNDTTSSATLFPPPASATSLPPTFPAQGSVATNPNNFFAGQFVLGRMAMVLAEKNTAVTPNTIPNTIVDPLGKKQWFIDRPTGTFPTTGDLTPLSVNSQLATGGGTTTSNDPGSPLPYIYNSRVDLASTSINNYRQKLTNFITANPYISTNISTWWWNYLMDGAYARFQCNPFVPKPMQAADMAHASPYLVAGCSQFIVEFAGDFLTQDNDPTHTVAIGRGTHSEYGDVNAPGSDGQIDFYVTYVNGQPVKQIAWYGMPRSTSGNTTISAANGDVVPLRDRFQIMYNSATGASFTGAYQSLPIAGAQYTNAVAGNYPTFERVGPKYQPTDYSSANGMTMTEAQTGYTCAFGPNDPKPKLIRITITLDDPTGRLPNGQTYQYVYQVP